jgi:hypothetical protein
MTSHLHRFIVLLCLLQRIDVWAANTLVEGEFRLQYIHEGVNETTDALRFDILTDNFAAHLKALKNLDEILVTHSYGVATNSEDVPYYHYSWTVTFMSEFQEPPLLVPLWFGHGCNDCEEFSATIPSSIDISFNPDGESIEQVMVIRTQTVGDLLYHQTIEAADKRAGDRFGASVHIDGDQIVVGAPYSSSITTTTWTFEAGTLQGWAKSGDAFDYQPTFGDNSYFRSVYGAPAEFAQKSVRPHSRTSGIGGKYYIGTFEKRPGNPKDYSKADSRFPPGSMQGDGPIGTLTSDTFIIPEEGSTIGFHIGGGCDWFTLYVELLVCYATLFHYLHY